MDNTPQFSFLKSIIGKILKSLIINYCILRRHMSFDQTTKQPLTNFEHQKP